MEDRRALLADDRTVRASIAAKRAIGTESDRNTFPFRSAVQALVSVYVQ